MSTDWTLLLHLLVSLGRWTCWVYPRISPWPFLCFLPRPQLHKSLGSGCRLDFPLPSHYGSDAGTRMATLGVYPSRSLLCFRACRLFRLTLADDPISLPHLLSMPPSFLPHLLFAPPAFSMDVRRSILDSSPSQVLHVLPRTISTSLWNLTLGVHRRSFL